MMNSLSMEIERSMSLLQLMGDERLLPPQEEEIKRINVIHKLKKIVMEWATRVAYQREFPMGCVMASCATIRVFGSYGLGVYNSNSDIDALCVGPYFATLEEDFFGVLHDMLASTPEVSEIICIKNGKVPMMRFNFDGIQFDLPYAKLNAPTILDVVDVLSPFLLKNIDDVSWRSMSGVVTNKIILELVPNIEVYQSLLRCVKFWANKRGLYGFGFGYFGGIHLAVLAAVICRRQPNAPLSALVAIFFQTYASWPWPMPVILEDNVPPIPRRSLMAIQLPGSNDFVWSNITKSTFDRIKTEFERGHALTKDFLLPDFEWRSLFEPFGCAKNYESFLKISVTSPHENELGDWVGWVKSRLRWLLFKLEELPGFCNPDSTEYKENGLQEPNLNFYWGLDTEKSKRINIKSIQEEFMKTVLMGRHGGTIGKMNLKLVRAVEYNQSKNGIRSTKNNHHKAFNSVSKTKNTTGSKGFRACIVDGSKHNVSRTRLHDDCQSMNLNDLIKSLTFLGTN